MANKTAFDELESLTKSLANKYAKQSNKGGGITFRRANEYEKVEFSSTGSFVMDSSININGGIPIGRITEIYGPEHSGKTTIALSSIAKWQENPKNVVVYFDSENSVDWAMAQNYYKVDLSKVMVISNNFTEHITNTMKDIVDNMYEKDPTIQILFVIDSIGALITEVEYEKKTEDNVMGIRAKKIKEGLLKVFTSNLITKNATIILLNQLYSNINDQYNPDETPGGRFIRFMATLRIQLLKFKKIVKGQETVGITIRGKIIKNKTAPAGKEFEIALMHGKGFDRSAGLFQQAFQKFIKIFWKEKETATSVHYKPEGHPDHIKFRSVPAAIEMIENDPAFAKKIDDEIKEWLAANKHVNAKFDDVITPELDNSVVVINPDDGNPATAGAVFDAVETNDEADTNIAELGLSSGATQALIAADIITLTQLKQANLTDIADILSPEQVTEIEQYIS